MAILLSKATRKELEQINNYAQKNDLFLEMRDKYGVLLAVSTGLLSLTEVKEKHKKPVYRVETKKILEYDTIVETIVYDIQISIYRRKKFLFKNSKTQDFFDKQENYWENCYKKFLEEKSYRKGSDVIIN